MELQLIAAWAATQYLAVQARLRPDRESERGDVPGWVMVTVMTAALVVAILGVFRTKITTAVTDAIDKVVNN